VLLGAWFWLVMGGRGRDCIIGGWCRLLCSAAVIWAGRGGSVGGGGCEVALYCRFSRWRAVVWVREWVWRWFAEVWGRVGIVRVVACCGGCGEVLWLSLVGRGGLTDMGRRFAVFLGMFLTYLFMGGFMIRSFGGAGSLVGGVLGEFCGGRFVFGVLSAFGAEEAGLIRIVMVLIVARH